MPVVAVIGVSGQSTLDKAKSLFDEGSYGEAQPLLTALNESDPKNGRVAYMLGVCRMEAGDESAAERLIAQGIKAGVPEATLAMAELSVRRYEVDAADENIEKYKRLFAKKRGKNSPKMDADAVAELEQRVERTRSMLGCVEKIAVIDSVVVDASTFFKAYKLSPESGVLNAPDHLPQGFVAADPTVVYTPQNGNLMLWAAPADDGSFGLMSSTRLADGSWEAPHQLGVELNEGGDANYPFMMADGVTLYYANDGENSLGGYDIFISRNDGDKYLQPQNVGMPYNSPYDDYMLAIDETTGTGWWATDRNRIPGKVTIYTFVTSDTRVNYPEDTPGLIDLARLRSIKDTQEEGAAYPVMMQTATMQTATMQTATMHINKVPHAGPSFSFALPGGRVCTKLSDFESAAAREAMERYLHECAEVEKTKSEIATLRQQYASGDSETGERIIALEKRLLNQSDETARLANEVVRLEINR